VEGWSHTTLFLSACADQAVSDYLLTGNLPATTSCSPDYVPFASMSAAAAMASPAAGRRQKVAAAMVPDVVRQMVR